MPEPVRPPLFLPEARGRPARPRADHRTTPEPARPRIPEVADATVVDLEAWPPARCSRAGLFLFLPLLAEVGFDRLVERAGYPGSRMIPATSALLVALATKLLGVERRSHVDPSNCDRALGLFAGLNVFPKKSFLTEYPYRSHGEHQRALLSGWVEALMPRLFPGAGAFSLDFHAIPHRGDEGALETHYQPMRGRAGPAVLTAFALEQSSACLCYSDANVTRAIQDGAVMRFVEHWTACTGEPPQWLCFDSRMTRYSELGRLNEAGVRFVTIRRRGARLVERLLARPGSDWKRAVIDIPKRRHVNIKYIEEMVSLRDYGGEVRQVAVAGLGRERPTLLITNDRRSSARDLVIRYAGRNRIEDALGTAVDFFHLDRLTSEVRLNVDQDAALTVLAQGCYRWLGSRLHGYGSAKPKLLFRQFVDALGQVRVERDRVVVRFERRSHNPVLAEAALDRGAGPIPWLGGRRVAFEFA